MRLIIGSWWSASQSSLSVHLPPSTALKFWLLCGSSRYWPCLQPLSPHLFSLHIFWDVSYFCRFLFSLRQLTYLKSYGILNRILHSRSYPKNQMRYYFPVKKTLKTSMGSRSWHWLLFFFGKVCVLSVEGLLSH